MHMPFVSPEWSVSPRTGFFPCDLCVLALIYSLSRLSDARLFYWLAGDPHPGEDSILQHGALCESAIAGAWAGASIQGQWWNGGGQGATSNDNKPVRGDWPLSDLHPTSWNHSAPIKGMLLYFFQIQYIRFSVKGENSSSLFWWSLHGYLQSFRIFFEWRQEKLLS